MIVQDNDYTIIGSVQLDSSLKQFTGTLKTTFETLPNFVATFGIFAKTYRLEGDLRYEYNPFRNLRLSSDVYDTNGKKIQRSGELIDFTTDIIPFDLNHPVNIEPQESYDGSINLIISDDKNPPMIVNSRFTPKEDDRYEVIDRSGNNDTNIYDQNKLVSQLRLYKTSDKISQVEFLGLENGGSNSCGNYNFYFKYSDADGNETDIVMESGMVSCYVGNVNDPLSIRGGILNEITDKIIKFRINNIDVSYEYLNIYYTRATSDLNKTDITLAYKIENKFPINKRNVKNNSLDISISGYEEVSEIDISEINVQYNIVNTSKTIAQCQNRLFMANVTKEVVPIKELTDLSLRIYPFASQNVNIGCLNSNYVDISTSNNKNEYYNAYNVYNYLGYWNKEMYRVGIVFILNNNSLSDVFSLRGINEIPLITNGDLSSISTNYTRTDLYTNGKRNYIEESDRYLVSGGKTDRYENTKGVIRISSTKPQIQNDATYPIGLNFLIERDVLEEINKYAKGFFFVRQKRIPTVLAQGFTIGLDDKSGLPSLPVKTDSDTAPNYIYETFIDKVNSLSHEFYDRIYKIPVSSNAIKDGKAMICPDASINYQFYNNLFTGTDFVVSKSINDIQSESGSKHLTNSGGYIRHFRPVGYKNTSSNYSNVLLNKIKLTNVEDGVPMRSSGTGRFSAKAGIAEEAWRFSFINKEDKSATATNLARGLYPSYVGIENYNKSCDFIDIHIQGYSQSNMEEYFYLRGSAEYPFYAISNRYDIKNLLSNNNSIYSFIEYRGDCFIGNYTVRMVRNFQDPELKINDIIVDFATWKSNYKGLTPQGSINKDSLSKINRSDVNAVQMGHWVTLKFCSNINLCYRTIDNSNINEYAITGKARSFYPLSPFSITGESKIPDSYTLNSGYNSTTSKKEYVPVHDVPYIKNIFDNRIMYSEINVSDAFKNGYRVFKGIDYQDYNSNYGTITKIVEWFSNIIVVFERAVCILPINERIISGNGEGGEIANYNYGIIGKRLMPLNNNYGSTWPDSVITSTNYIYGMDLVAKKIWRTDGKTFELISDFKVQKFINDNISLGERELTPSIALRGIKSHFNLFKQDIIFTFYDLTRSNDEVVWSLCYNEKLGKWITRYSWIPLSTASIGNVFFSYDRNSAKNTALLGYSDKDNISSEGVVFDSVELSTGNLTKEMSLKFLNTSDETLLHYNNYYTVEYYLTNPNDADEDLSAFDNTSFSINQNNLTFIGNSLNKFIYRLKIFVILRTKSGAFYDSFADIIALRPSQSSYVGDINEYNNFYTSRFWKHGQAGIFDWADEVLPSNWYGEDHPFELEFVVSDSGQVHKIYDNLRIISNSVEPDSMEVTIVGDSYDEFKDYYNTLPNITFICENSDSSQITKYNKKTGISKYQKLRNIKTFGRIRSNMEYKEDYWNIEIKSLNLPAKYTVNRAPIKNKITVGVTDSKEAKLRDKYAKIRIRYKGTNRVIINQIQTIYTQSYA